MQSPRNCTTVLYVFIQDHLLGGSPGYCLATQYWQQSWQRPTGRLTGRLIAFSGSARGHKSGLSSFPTVHFCAIAHEVSPLLITVGWLWEKTDPCWDLELTACFEGIVLCVRPSPRGLISYSRECAELYAACKSMPGNIEQGWWSMYFTQ